MKKSENFADIISGSSLGGKLNMQGMLTSIKNVSPFQVVFDYRPGDVFGCVADIGWITGHSYVVYGPLVNGATTVLFESTPTHPDPGRYWETVQRLKINQVCRRMERDSFLATLTMDSVLAVLRSAHRDSAAAEVRRGLCEEVRPLVAADPRLRRRAHQPRGLALVQRRRRRRKVGFGNFELSCHTKFCEIKSA